MLLLWLILAPILALAVHWAVRVWLVSRDSMPIPLPARCPIFGASAKAAFYLDSLHKEGLKETLEMFKAGHDKGIARGFLFHLPVVAISRPEFLRRMFVTDWRIFDRNVLEQQAFEPVLGGGIILASNDVWKHGREMLEPAFKPAALRQYSSVFSERAGLLMEHLEKQLANDNNHSIDVDMQVLFQQAAFDITCIVTLGNDVSTIGQDQRFFHAWEQILADLNFRFFVPIPIWLRRFFRTSAIVKYDRALALLDDIVYQTIRTASASDPTFLGFILQERERQIAAGETPLTDKQIRDHLLTLLMAAHDTTTNLMTFALYYIATQPGLDEEISKELLAVVGSRAPLADEHITNMKLLRSVFFETLRLHPSAPMRGRTVTEDVEFDIPDDPNGGKYKLGKGTHAAWSAYTIHRIPSLWENPNTFDPSRFSDEAQRNRLPFTYVPFGAGPRRCLGEAFSLREATILVGSLLQKFKFELVPGTVVDDAFALTMRSKHPLMMRAQLRC